MQYHSDEAVKFIIMLLISTEGWICPCRGCKFMTTCRVLRLCCHPVSQLSHCKQAAYCQRADTHLPCRRLHLHKDMARSNTRGS